MNWLTVFGIFCERHPSLHNRFCPGCALQHLLLTVISHLDLYWHQNNCACLLKMTCCEKCMFFIILCIMLNMSASIWLQCLQENNPWSRLGPVPLWPWILEWMPKVIILMIIFFEIGTHAFCHKLHEKFHKSSSKATYFEITKRPVQLILTRDTY